MRATAPKLGAHTLAGSRVGPYVLGREIASGGTGVVHLARSLETGRQVALKLIARDGSPDTLRLFEREARIASTLRHENVCRVVDFGAEETVLYLAMEYLEGAALVSVVHHAFHRGILPRWFGTRVMADAARGIQAAHDLSGPDGAPLHVVHGDITPENIVVLFDGTTRVIDFGVAHLRAEEPEVHPRQVRGKPAYLAPEQIEGPRVDHRADVWALGVCLWEATVGEPLFEGETSDDTILKVLHAPIPTPRSIDSAYPRGLEDIVMSALERDPEARTGSAGALADALEAHLAASSPYPARKRVSRWMLSRMLPHHEPSRAQGDGAMVDPADASGSRPAVRLDAPLRAVEESGTMPRARIEDED